MIKNKFKRLLSSRPGKVNSGESTSSEAKQSKMKSKTSAKEAARKDNLVKAQENMKSGLPLLNHLTSKKKVIIMLAVMSATFLVALDSTLMSTAINKIASDFNAYSSYSWLLTSYLLTFTIAIPIGGKLSDLFGRKPMLLTGLIVFVLGSLGSSSAGSIGWLISWRALQGLGGGLIMANSFTIIGDLFTPRERGRWQGLISSVFGLASVAGPLIGGAFADTTQILGVAGWRWSFLINVPIGLAAVALIWAICPMIKHAKRAEIDWLGAGALAVAISAVIFAADSASKTFSGLINAGWSLTTIELVLWGIVVLFVGLFILAENRARDPIIPNRFWKNRTYTASMIAWIFFGATMMSFILYITQFNQQVFLAGRSDSATMSGLMLFPAIIGMSVMSAISGQMVTKTGRYKFMMVIGFVLVTASAAASSTLKASSPFWYEAIWQIICGAGLGMSMPTLNLAVQNAFHQKDLGVATSSSQFFRSLGQTIGTAVLGSMMTAGVAGLIGNASDMKFMHDLENVAKTGINKDLAGMLDGQKIDTDLAISINGVLSKSNVGDMAKGLSGADGYSQLKLAIAKYQVDALNKTAVAMGLSVDDIPSNAKNEITQQVKLQVLEQANITVEDFGKMSTNKDLQKIVNNLSQDQIAEISKNIESDFADFHKKVTDAFVAELSHIFVIVSVLSAIGALIVTFGVKEKVLRGSTDGTPGEDIAAESAK